MNTELKAGDKVLFGRSHGEQTLGEVVRVNRAKIKVKQLESRGTMRSYPVGALWNVPPALCHKVDEAGRAIPVLPVPPKPKRTEAEIMQEIKDIYCGLSPENISCDGELPMSVVRRRGQQLRARLRLCFQELGRQVTEEEAFGLPTYGRTT